GRLVRLHFAAALLEGQFYGPTVRQATPVVGGREPEGEAPLARSLHGAHLAERGRLAGRGDRAPDQGVALDRQADWAGSVQREADRLRLERGAKGAARERVRQEGPGAAFPLARVGEAVHAQSPPRRRAALVGQCGPLLRGLGAREWRMEAGQ